MQMLQRTIRLRTQSHPVRFFQTCRSLRQISENHYAVLDVSPHASAKDIKRQFYALSKKHHPDHNKNDPNAAQRFIKISEAYATLGNTTAREAYDRTLRETTQSNGTRGSGFGASSGPGGRPASGLSRRRSPFYGPPPSFYRNQGQSGSSRAHQRESRPFWTTEDEDISHFDTQSHLRTQQSQEQRWARRTARNGGLYAGNAADVFVSFFIIGGIVGAAISVTILLEGWTSPRRSTAEKSR